MMRIRHVVRGRLNPDNADGIIVHTHRLAHAQLQLGHDVEVYGVATRGSEPEVIDRSGLTVRSYPWSRISTAVHPELRELIETEDANHSDTIFHLQPPQDPAVYGVGRLLQRVEVPYMVSPHAMWSREALARGRAKKLAYKALLDNRLVARAVGVHATAAAEVSDIRRYAPHARAFVVRNSLDIAEIESIPPAPDFWHTRFGVQPETKVIVFLGRLDPYQKGLDILVDAWDEVASDSAVPAVLALIGTPWRDSHDHLIEMIDRSRTPESVLLTGPLFGTEKYQALAAANAYVQVSRYETSPYSIQEALACGLPAIVSGPTNFADAVAGYDAGRAVDLDVRSIAGAISAVLAMPDEELRAIGENARRLVRERHSVARAAARMVEAYQAAISGAPFDDDD